VSATNHERTDEAGTVDGRQGLLSSSTCVICSESDRSCMHQNMDNSVSKTNANDYFDGRPMAILMRNCTLYHG